TSAAAGMSSINSAAASDTPSLLHIGMPIEYVNYTITRENGTLWAKIDGTYPLHVVFEPADETNFDDTAFFVTSDELPLVYPTPPGTTNIHVKINETELSWSNYTEIYPSALHHTAIGDWPMFNCTISPIPDDFVLKIHYEHPIALINGSYLFLYDLNISPYLSSWSPNSTAYFTIRIETNASNLRAYTTETDSTWNPKNYTLSKEDTTETVTIQMYSELSQPLAGDLVVMFSDSSAQIPDKFPYWVIVPLLIVIAVLAVIVYRKKHRQ
ncbi:hypothetical protein MUO79_02840, partial [Candidatus Bathyarchaeota archaeon]|nr:hypothetical protein [Candidatus Bathyarchaeota archaeon]